MGMGDEKQKYRPVHRTRTDSVTRLPFVEIATRKCPHPAVQARYGNDCIVSVYICKRCQHGVKAPLCDAWACGFEKQQKVGDEPTNGSV